MRLGYEKGFDEKKIALYTDRKFTQGQMYQIYKGVKHGLTLKQVKVYAKKEFDENQMLIIRLCLEKGYNCDEIDFDKLKTVDLEESYIKFLDEEVLAEEDIDVKKLTLG